LERITRGYGGTPVIPNNSRNRKAFQVVVFFFFFFFPLLLLLLFTLKTNPLRLFQTLELNIYLTTWYNIPEDLNLQHHCCENLEIHTKTFLGSLGSHG
jgi:hypothetical protein